MDTQKCSQCSEEKPVSQFHRRADQYQKICKTCRLESSKAEYNSHGKTRKTTTPVINKENVPALAEIVAGIESHLRAKASRYADHALEADDIYGAMVEAILTKSDPTDSMPRILQRADWAGREYLQSKRVYCNRVDGVEDDSEQFTASSTVEEEVVQHEVSSQLKSIIAQLPADYQKVISLLAVGTSQKKIAEELHVSEQAVSEKVKRIGNKMVTLGFSFA